MKPHAIAALLSLVLALAAPATETPGGATDCRHADAVFLSTDSARLATELGTYTSACADYWISITPSTGPSNNGYPRGGTPLTAIHAQGPQFHALAEIRLNPWAIYAAANGWYAAGVRVRDLMAAAGYTANDSWIVNEVGWPSGTSVGVDVYNGADGARRNLLDFVRGLYTGDGTPMPGGVFAANPLQVQTDLAQYKSGLLSWLSDGPFWGELGAYVRFWAQETYADARLWGVAGAPLEQRTAYLNDYFRHAERLAAEGSAATAAAHAFFDTTYTPLGNAAYRQGLPNLDTGIGFGFTDVPLATMLSFVSEQTVAHRLAGDRFGYAFVPKNATGTENAAVADRLGQAIRDSATDPLGACGDFCGATVDGAVFNDAWRFFPDLTPPTVTCTPSPDVLWPPNGKLVPVHVDVQVTDALSGPAGFTLTDVAVSEGSVADDVAGFDVGTPDVDGELRAERAGGGDGRTYTLTYTAADRAGNTARCEATVIAPHDEGQ